ncbi:MAG: bifunctional precorrin-2 dehydrogenase/sirohydrochlorin ferrochelatase [Chitinispirillaceae bacterium]|nr:bifunctional precorrin-2 dehydrogenase/sirohydrochlorin ferrochelatase [Chitinispirillaceae bacterium]
MMYPVFLDLAGRQCLVVGGGRVALRKVCALLRAEAAVIVVAVKCCSRLRSLGHRIELHERQFRESDLTSALTLVIGATDDERVNRAISRRASLLNIPCNIVDQPSLCSFIVPAQVRRGDVTIAISTGGTAPRLARYLKDAVAKAISPLHGELAAYLGVVRRGIRSELPTINLRSAFWEELFAVDPIDEITSSGWESFRNKTERLIKEHRQKASTNGKK